MKLRYLILVLFTSLALASSCLGSDMLINLPLAGDLLDKKNTLAAGEIKRSSAATYISSGVLRTADGDDTPFSHSSVEDETGATSMRGSFVDSQTWFHDAGGLVAVYAGTGNLLKLDDGAGSDYAYGFIGEVGTGETLGADLFDAGAGVFTAGTYSWVAQGNNTIANDANSLKVTYVDSVGGAYLYLQDATDFTANLEVGKLYKLVGDAKVGAGDSVFIYIRDSSGLVTSASAITGTNFTSFEVYFVATETSAMYIHIYGMSAGEEIWLDNLVLKEVTEPNANAVHIYKEHSLTTEGWNAIDTGIDYNADSSWDFDVYVNLLSSSGGTAQPRFEDGWLLVEGEATNHCLYSRDLSNAVWSKTDCTGAKNQIGLDGVANSASLLTATGANGTAFQTLAMASSAKSYYVYLKRSVGSGTISITDDGGGNYTTCTGLSSSAFTKYRITRTQANPVVGFKITTSGDAIIVDCNQLEQTAFSTSFIPTTSIPVTRTTEAGSAADNGYSWTISQSLKNILDDAEPVGSPTDSQGTLLFDVKWGCDESDIAAANHGFVSVTDSQLGPALFGQTGFAVNDGTSFSLVNSPAFSAGDIIYYASRWGDVDGNANDISAGLSDGTWVFDATPANYDGEFALGTDLRLSFSNLYPLHIRNIQFHSTPYSQAELSAGIYRRVLKWMMHFELP